MFVKRQPSHWVRLANLKQLHLSRIYWNTLSTRECEQRSPPLCLPSTSVWEMPPTRQNQQAQARFTLRKVKSLRKWTLRSASLIRKGFYLANKFRSCKRPGNQNAVHQKVTQN